jgi:hypothetical protein
MCSGAVPLRRGLVTGVRTHNSTSIIGAVRVRKLVIGSCGGIIVITDPGGNEGLGIRLEGGKVLLYNLRAEDY